MTDQVKAAVTVAEMARMVGLSRARFYQLQKMGVFPAPRIDEVKQRPFYDEEAQLVCLEVRRRNCGVNGQVVLFYARRQTITPTGPRPRKPTPVPRQPKYALVDALASLGLVTTPAQVESAVQELFGSRGPAMDRGEVLRAVFLHLKKRQNPADNVGR